MNLVKYFAVIAVVSFLNFKNPAFAQDYDDAFNLETIVVTPSAGEVSYSKAARAVDVIKGSELKAVRTTSDLTYVLENVPSLQITDYGNIGQAKTVTLRGASSSNVLVMIDSRPINSPQNGVADLSRISADDIERIEVVRGPSSSLYGSNAIGGVINIITKKAKKSEFNYSTSVGSFETWQNIISQGLKFKDGDIYLNFNNLTTKGYRDNSEHTEYNFDSKSNVQINEENSVVFTAGCNYDKTNLPGRVNAPTLDQRQLDSKNYFNLKWIFEPCDATKIQMTAFQNFERTEAYESYVPLDKSAHVVKKRSINFQLDQELLDFYDITFGIEGEENTINSSDNGKHRYLVRTTYLENHFDFDRFQLFFGGRTDNYSSLQKDKTRFNPSCNASYEIARWFKIRGLVGTSFRIPTFNDLYWPATSWAEGNPNLSPEKAFSYEGGTDFIFSKDFNLGMTYFGSKFTDQIQWAEGADWVWRPTNIASSKVDGFELESKMRFLERFESSFSYTFERVIDDRTKKDIFYKPRNRASLILSYKIPDDLFISTNMQAVQSAFADDAHLNTIKGYFVVNLYLSKNVNKNLEVFANIDNVFNKNYQTALEYPMPPFNFNIGGKLKF